MNVVFRTECLLEYLDETCRCLPPMAHTALKQAVNGTVCLTKDERMCFFDAMKIRTSNQRHTECLMVGVFSISASLLLLKLIELGSNMCQRQPALRWVVLCIWEKWINGNNKMTEHLELPASLFWDQLWCCSRLRGVPIQWAVRRSQEHSTHAIFYWRLQN